MFVIVEGIFCPVTVLILFEYIVRFGQNFIPISFNQVFDIHLMALKLRLILLIIE